MDESSSYAEVLEKLGMSRHGANNKTLRQYIEKFQIDLTNINRNRDAIRREKIRNANQVAPLEDIITGVYQGEYKGNKLAERLIMAGYKERKCECCGLSEWLGNPIPLHLHHKDGNHSNNLLENLQLVCPNCHSLTDNYAGKNIKHQKPIPPEDNKKITKKGVSEDGQRLYDGYGNYKILCPVCKTNFMNRNSKQCKKCYEEERIKPKIPKEELYNAIDETNSYSEVGRRYGYDKKTISKWHKYYAEEDRKNGVVVIASENAPQREQLKEEIRIYSFEQVGKMHGDVNGNTVKKWCVRYGLPSLKSDIDNMSDDEWANI